MSEFTAAEEVSEAGTGAVRSTDLAKERWELMSGSAIDELAAAMARFHDFSMEIFELVAKSRWYLGRFLGGNGMDELGNGWACLNVALQKQDSEQGEYDDWVVQTITRQMHPSNQVRYDLLPFHGLKHIATTNNEGSIKYGIHNWYHGFQVLDLCNHTDRHLAKWLNGCRKENHLGHCNWGFMTPMHMLKHRPDMCLMLLGSNWTLTEEIKENHRQMALARGSKTLRRDREPMDAPPSDTYLAWRKETHAREELRAKLATYPVAHNQKDLDFDARVKESQRARGSFGDPPHDNYVTSVDVDFEARVAEAKQAHDRLVNPDPYFGLKQRQVEAEEEWQLMHPHTVSVFDADKLAQLDREIAERPGHAL